MRRCCCGVDVVAVLLSRGRYSIRQHNRLKFVSPKANGVLMVVLVLRMGLGRGLNVSVSII